MNKTNPHDLKQCQRFEEKQNKTHIRANHIFFCTVPVHTSKVLQFCLMILSGMRDLSQPCFCSSGVISQVTILSFIHYEVLISIILLKQCLPFSQSPTP